MFDDSVNLKLTHRYYDQGGSGCGTFVFMQDIAYSII